MTRPVPLPLNVRRHKGPGDSETPVVLLHGLLGSGSNWHSHARRLAERRPVLVPDLRNHGHSPHSPDVRYAAMAADLLALLDCEELERVALVGHSMGGKVAMHCALSAPDRIERLVIVDIAPVAYPSRYQFLFEALQSVDLDSLEGRAQADEHLEQFVPEVSLRQFLLQNLVKDAGGWSWRINLSGLAEGEDLLMGFEVPPDIGPYEGPTLVVHGASSDYVVAPHRGTFLQLFPRAEFCEIYSAGHWVHADQPDRFHEVVSHFMETA